METGDIGTALGACGLFDNVEPQALHDIAGRCSVRRFRRGQPLFFAGDSGDALYIVRTGGVKLYLTSAEGYEVLVDVVRPPHALGELSAVDGQPRSTSAEAVEDTDVVVMSGQVLLDAVRRHPGAAEHLLALMAATLRRVTTRMSDLVFLDLPGRLAKLLLTLAEAQRKDGGGQPLEVQLTLSQTDLAHMIGASRQALNTALGGFEHRGLIRRSGQTVVILDPEALRRRAGEIDASPEKHE
jgi:CRP/FNR family cyclic AMP-dependent transcriptional regulator